METKGFIRTAESEDIDYIREIYNDAVRNTTATFDMEEKTEEQMQQWFLNHNSARHFALVYETDGRIAGYASLSSFRERAAFDGTVENSVYIHPDFRGRGIGTLLLDELIKRADEATEIHTILALITHENETSIRMHLKSGFHLCGTIKDAGLKFGRYLDLDIYQLICKNN